MRRIRDFRRRDSRCPARGGFRPGLEVVEARLLLANFVVNTTSDSPQPDLLTLRQAIAEADATPGPNTISFSLPALNIPGLVDFDPDFGLWHFQVDSPLPTISNQVSIDGDTQRVITDQAAANEAVLVTDSAPTNESITFTLIDSTSYPSLYLQSDPTLRIPDQTLTVPNTDTAAELTAYLQTFPNLKGNVTVSGTSINTTGLSITFDNRLGVRQTFDVGSPESIPSTAAVTVSAMGNSGDITSDPNTQAIGFTGKVRVILDGASNGVAASFPGLTIDTDHSQIRGLAIDGFQQGIVIGPDQVGNLIQGDEVGYYTEYFNPTFLDTDAHVAGVGNSGAGIVVSSDPAGSTANNTIGGVAPQAHDAIAGNGAQGIIIGQGAGGNQVVGNLIGVLEQDPSHYFQLGNHAEGVLVESDSNAIGGDAAGATNVISANQSYGIHVVGASAVKNRIEANYIGTDVNGTFVFGQGNPGNGQDSPISTGNLRDGIFIDDAPATQIGVAGGAGGNVISDNFGAGIRVSGSAAIGTVIQANQIGTDLAGTESIPNRKEGIILATGMNTVGGTATGAGNLISGNLRGILLIGGLATGNQIQGNTIGTDAKGAYDLGNAVEGILIDDAPGNTVGGTTSAARNLISGNDVGVRIEGDASSGNVLLGNYVGTDATGLLDVGNSEAGVTIDGAPANSVGGSTSGSGNVISANHSGVVLDGAATVGNAVEWNIIGFGSDGVTPLGNEVDGVLIDDSASNNVVGGLAADQGDTIGGNVRDGVRVEGAQTVGDAILSNSIYGNGALGIDLVSPTDPPNAVTPNTPSGSASGPNMLLNKPVLTSVASTSNGILIVGGYRGAANSTYVIQLFASLVANPTGFGDGMTYLGTTTVATGSDGVGTFVGSFPTVVTPGEFVTATATDFGGNTSEFSATIVEAIGSLSLSMPSYTVSEADGMATITVDRVGGSGGYATVQYMVSNGTALYGILPGPDANYTSPSGVTLGPLGPNGLPTYYVGTLVFDTGINTASFSIPLLDDGSPGSTTTVNLAIMDPTGSATIGTPSTATLNILNSNLPGVFSFSTPSYVVNEAQGSITISVVRDTPGIAASVSYATQGGSAVPGVRYQPVSGTLNFATGQTVATFTIPINDDTILEGDQTVGLFLGDPTNGATLGIPASALLTIQDDTRDRTGPVVRSVSLLKNRNQGVTGLAIAFSEPLDPATATNLINYGYSVRTAGLDHKFGTKDDVLVPINTATYDPNSLTVTLSLGRVIHPPTPFQLAINQSTSVSGAGVGVSDLAGNLLDGEDNGENGTPFVAVLKGKTGGITVSSIAANSPGIRGSARRHSRGG